MMPVAYIYYILWLIIYIIWQHIHTYIHTYIRGSYILIKQEMNKSKKNYIKIVMPVAKHTTEYASKCCLEGILSA